MGELYRAARLDALRSTQNADGGWGYFAGKRSWLEPTAYALLALHESSGTEAWRRGWNLVRSWQSSDGSFRPNAQTAEAHWSTALAVTLHCAQRRFDEVCLKGVNWLLTTRGEESTLISRVRAGVFGNTLGHDHRFAGWPWLPGTNGWIEPTSHALVALKRAAPHVASGGLRERIALAESMILARRCADGGWNYGNRAALGVNLPSYPETTAIALLGLQACSKADLSPDLARAAELWRKGSSRLGRAWLALSLSAFGRPVTGEATETIGRDILAIALEALSSPGGGHQFLRPEAAA